MDGKRQGENGSVGELEMWAASGHSEWLWVLDFRFVIFFFLTVRSVRDLDLWAIWVGLDYKFVDLELEFWTDLGLKLDWTKFLNGFGIRIDWAKDWGTLKKKKIIGVNLKNRKSWTGL